MLVAASPEEEGIIFFSRNVHTNSQKLDIGEIGQTEHSTEHSVLVVLNEAKQK